MAFTADKRYYCNRELTELVDEDYPDGAVLLVAEGGMLTDEDAATWGLGSGTAKDGPKPSAEQAFANAQGLPRETKAIKGSANKAQSAPDADKGTGGGVTFSGSEPQNAPAVSGADAPSPQIQDFPENLTAPGS